MSARFSYQVFDMPLAASAWLLGLDTAKIAFVVGVSEAVVYSRIDEIRATARAMLNPPPAGGEEVAA